MQYNMSMQAQYWNEGHAGMQQAEQQETNASGIYCKFIDAYGPCSWNR